MATMATEDFLTDADFTAEHQPPDKDKDNPRVSASWRRRLAVELGLYNRDAPWVDIASQVSYREYRRDVAFAGAQALRYTRVEVERLTAEVERLRRVGICGDRCPGSFSALVCDLLAGHEGWHGADNDAVVPAGYAPSRCSWTERGEEPADDRPVGEEAVSGLTPVQQAAAFHGMTMNMAVPPVERFEFALQALDLYATEVERLTEIVALAEAYATARFTSGAGAAGDALVFAVERYRTAGES